MRLSYPHDMGTLVRLSRHSAGRIISGRGTGADPSRPGQAAFRPRWPGSAGRAPAAGDRAVGSIGLVVSEPCHQAADGPLVGHVYGDAFFGRIVSGILSVLGPRHVHPVLIHVDSAAARDELLGGCGRVRRTGSPWCRYGRTIRSRSCLPIPASRPSCSPGRRAKCRSASSTSRTGAVRSWRPAICWLAAAATWRPSLAPPICPLATVRQPVEDMAAEMARRCC